jgi:predicted PurR-regulated permease PerM
LYYAIEKGFWLHFAIETQGFDQILKLPSQLGTVDLPRLVVASRIGRTVGMMTARMKCRFSQTTTVIRANFNARGRSSWPSVTVLLASIVLVIGVLYWSRGILIPIALAILLTFILAPIITFLGRLKMGRTSSVVLIVILTFVLLGAIGTMITSEFRSLGDELPNYRQNIRKKISDLRLASKGGPLEKLQEMVKEVIDEIKKEEPTEEAGQAAAIPVVVTREQPAGNVLGLLMERLASAGLVIVLVIFMLLRREDLRDRLLRLAGYSHMAATTKAIDEAGKRISKYLFRQFLVNTGYGVAVGAGLYFIDLPYALLWGFFAGLTRFIPYIGSWLGALGPMLMSLTVFDGWSEPLLVIGLIAGLELINNVMVEPRLYGESIGVSEVALLIMIAFWTWLWGPIGLLLATPLTVCLMVISKSVPDLEFISLLLGSEPVLAPHQVFYQRLVAKVADEGQGIVDAFLETHSPTELFELLLIPTLISLRHDYVRGRVNDKDQKFVLQFVRQILEDAESLGRPKAGESSQKRPAESLESSPSAERVLVFGCPAHDEADELALMMLSQSLRAEQREMRVLSSAMLFSERLTEVEQFKPALVCVGLLPEGALFPVRQFCKLLHSHFPELPIIVGRWGAGKQERLPEPFSNLVSAIGWTLEETKNQVIQFAQISSSTAPLPQGNARPQPQPLK